MSIASRIKQWFGRSGPKSAAEELTKAPLREFVYLDDVSVYSLTASRLGAIATEFTEREARTLGTDVESSLEASGGLAKASVRARSSSSREQSSQVLRKSIIQTAFKNLHDLEADALRLRLPTAASSDGVEVPGLAIDGERVVDPHDLKRGQLIELEVELEAEAVFRVNAVVSAFLEIVHEDLEAFGVVEMPGLTEARAVNRLLDRLLTGLVPLRGRAVDFVAVRHGDQELVVHNDVLMRMAADQRPAAFPLYVVGEAEQRLFWKDIRRVLFSNSRYRLFGRISHTGLQERWTPVKLAEVLKQIAPEIEGQLLDALGENALIAMGEGVARNTDRDGRRRETLERAARSFALAVASHHGRQIADPRLALLLEVVVDPTASLATVDDSRQFFHSVLGWVDAELGLATPAEVALAARGTATIEAGLGLGGSLAPSVRSSQAPTAVAAGRFLETEIVAIYW